VTGATPWQIDPDTLTLTGPHRRFTAHEFNRQAWPPCPVCRTTTKVDRLDVPHLDNPEPVYIAGHWECPRGCDPRSHRPPKVGDVITGHTARNLPVGSIVRLDHGGIDPIHIAVRPTDKEQDIPEHGVYTIMSLPHHPAHTHGN
jgi:hypothetical protein